MAIFIGDYTCKVDVKGRILFPAAFKKQLSGSETEPCRESFVLKKDIFEQCLILYPIDEWNRQIELLRARINPYNKEHNQFFRGFFRGTAELALDGSCRLLIPKRLLDLAGIDKDIVMAGQDGKIEIWAKEIYESNADSDTDFALLAQKILGNQPIDI